MSIYSWRKLCFIALLLPLCSFYKSYAQADTIKLTIAESEKIFLKENFSLLAARYNIDANKALVRQAKSWDNPVISTDQNIYDKQGKFFSHNAVNGQVYLQVMQLIKTAGKRSKLVQLAADNTAMTTAQFDDLARTLRYELISDFIEIQHQLTIRQIYTSEMNEMETLATAMDAQLKAGSISLKDNLRIKALLFSLQNEIVNVDAQIIPLQSEVKLLLRKNDTAFVLPVLSYQLPSLISVQLPPDDTIKQIAISNRPDVRLAQSQLLYAKDNLVYQKALAKADINIGTEYDQRSSYAPDYVGLAISLPLNILNRNRGNISSARYLIAGQQTLYDAQLSKVENDINTSITRIRYFQQVNNPQQQAFAQQYESVFKNMLQSYKLRQVSLLEFIDFADAYNETRLKILEQHTSLIKAFAELNYLAGQDIIILN